MKQVVGFLLNDLMIDLLRVLLVYFLTLYAILKAKIELLILTIYYTGFQLVVRLSLCYFCFGLTAIYLLLMAYWSTFSGKSC